MCLGIPAKVIEIYKAHQGKVDYLGTKIQVDFSLVDNIQLNDWVIVHAGFAIAKLNEQEAAETFELLREYAQFITNVPDKKEEK
ncbi:HypC/HybG/HupF family hydrogenase formation chaperone [Candidatus Aminicenantes bacterium AC-334-K16]|jgi:hydrogenase expression/formation protein HypC|nr:HypC/HybG/HupF family hydrogenase formation chaperone [Candidatus Aminicenantes bacterium AC-334-K16]